MTLETGKAKLLQDENILLKESLQGLKEEKSNLLELLRKNFGMLSKCPSFSNLLLQSHSTTISSLSSQ